MSTMIIGEFAGCHDLEASKAKRLVQAARDAGCDAIKVQWCSDINRMAERRRVASSDVYKRLSFPASWHSTFKADCRSDPVHPLEYVVTVFIQEDIPLIARFANRIKIASLEASDSELIRACIATGKPVIISTGCIGQDEYLDLRWAYLLEGYFGQVSWLHAVAAYPVPIGESNLSCLSRKARYFFDGYSDQTGRVITGALAVVAGAKILEVHCRLDDTDPANPDYSHSLTPDQLTEYVRLVRLAEAEMGDGRKRVQKLEEPLRKHRVISR